jgi:hypothetical protein
MHKYLISIYKFGSELETTKVFVTEYVVQYEVHMKNTDSMFIKKVMMIDVMVL